MLVLDPNLADARSYGSQRLPIDRVKAVLYPIKLVARSATCGLWKLAEGIERISTELDLLHLSAVYNLLYVPTVAVAGAGGMMNGMAVIHISEAEAVRNFAGLLAQVRAGAEIAIGDASFPVAVLHMPVPVRRSIAECIALLPEDSSATIDEDFARDVQDAVAAHREPLDASVWE